MSWSRIKAAQVVKRNGKCLNKAMWKYCPYWAVRKSADNGRTLGFYCSLFGETKNTDASLPQCNSQYGLDYDGDA